MKKFLLTLTLSLLPICYQTAAQAVSLKLIPSLRDVPSGQSFDVKVEASDLGKNQPPSISTFDFDLNFNPSLLSFEKIAFGDPSLGDLLDLSGQGYKLTTVGNGTVNFYELSVDLPSQIQAAQPDRFTFATLTFATKAVGTSPLGLSVNALGDKNGDPLNANIEGSSIQVRDAVTVPEPSTALSSMVFGLMILLKRSTSRAAQKTKSSIHH